MNIHRRIYTEKNNDRLYFSGTYTGELVDGALDVEWEWSKAITEATILHLTDAWDLLFTARYMWPEATIELERNIL